MKKSTFILLTMLLLLPSVATAGLSVEKIDNGSLVIAEVSNPVKYEFHITNPGHPDTIEIYSLVGVEFSPRGSFDIPSGTTSVQVTAYPSQESLKRVGPFTFQYNIKSQQYGIFTDILTYKVINLADSLEVKGEKLHLADREANIVVKNLQNVNLNNLTIRFSSVFFDEVIIISLAPFEETIIRLPINPDKMKKLVAGSYVFQAEVMYAKAKARFEGVIPYLEGQSISVQRTVTGFLIRKTTITKTNEGNVPAPATIEITRDVFARLFTAHSLVPESAEREGLFMRYTWTRELRPQESLSIITTTNYTYSFIFLLLIIVVAVLVKLYLRSPILLHKEVSFVKTRGGEFALRVRIRVKAKKDAEQVQIIDRLPATVRLYEKGGSIPDKIEHATRRLFWHIPRLNAGEERVYSYIIYSKVRIVGRFELPHTIIAFSHEGKKEQVTSNKAYFVSETTHIT